MNPFIFEKKGVSAVVGALLLFTIIVILYIFTQNETSSIVDVAFNIENRDLIGSQVEFLDIQSGPVALIGVKKKIENNLSLSEIVINSTTCFSGEQELTLGINVVSLSGVGCSFSNLHNVVDTRVTINNNVLYTNYQN